MSIVTTTEMFKKAYKEGYAIGAFNVNNMEIIQGIMEAAGELRSPVILQVSNGARKYAGHNYIVKLVEAATMQYKDIPVALHLDHGADFEMCKSCIDGGFTSVMIDGSQYSFKENIELTKKVVDYDVNVEHHSYTKPEEVEEFVSKTGVDSLAIAIGTSHGAFKFKPGTKPQLRFDILEEVSKRLPEFPIVLHGASSVSAKYVDIINSNGGKLKDAVGIPEDMLRKAAKSSVCKINIDSDIRLAMTAGVREALVENEDMFDPRVYLKQGRAYVKELVEHKMINVLGSNGKA